MLCGLKDKLRVNYYEVDAETVLQGLQFDPIQLRLKIIYYIDRIEHKFISNIQKNYNI